MFSVSKWRTYFYVISSADTSYNGGYWRCSLFGERTGPFLRPIAPEIRLYEMRGTTGDRRIRRLSH